MSRAIQLRHYLGCLYIFLVMPAAAELTLVKHYDGTFSPKLNEYLTDVLELILENTVTEYGPYELRFYSKTLSTNRVKLETERGDLVNVQFSPVWSGNLLNPNNVIQVEFPIFYGMLSLRSLIVYDNDDSGLRLSTVDSYHDMQQFRVGQGAGWGDTDILKANQIEVVEAQMYEFLFPMLARNRFDYISLSVLEAQASVEASRSLYPNLRIHQGLNLFYPMPLFLYVNADQEKIARRLAAGLDIAFSDGSLKQIFDGYFHQIQADLVDNKKKLVILHNPTFTEEENKTLVKQFINQFEPRFIILKP